jgi:hypothetical protein
MIRWCNDGKRLEDDCSSEAAENEAGATGPNGSLGQSDFHGHVPGSDESFEIDEIDEIYTKQESGILFWKQLIACACPEA